MWSLHSTYKHSPCHTHKSLICTYIISGTSLAYCRRSSLVRTVCVTCDNLRHIHPTHRESHHPANKVMANGFYSPYHTPHTSMTVCTADYRITIELLHSLTYIHECMLTLQ